MGHLRMALAYLVGGSAGSTDSGAGGSARSGGSSSGSGVHGGTSSRSGGISSSAHGSAGSGSGGISSAGGSVSSAGSRVSSSSDSRCLSRSRSRCRLFFFTASGKRSSGDQCGQNERFIHLKGPLKNRNSYPEGFRTLEYLEQRRPDRTKSGKKAACQPPLNQRL